MDELKFVEFSEVHKITGRLHSSIILMKESEFDKLEKALEGTRFSASQWSLKYNTYTADEVLVMNTDLTGAQYEV